MKSLTARYKKYRTGGLFDGIQKADLAGGIGQGAAVISGLADSLGPADQYGKKPLASNLLGSAGKFASMGSALGPVGAGIGAAVGLGVGLLTNGKQKREAEKLKFQEHLQDYRRDSSMARARVAADPSIVHGNLRSNYYAMGGPLNVTGQKTKGGSLTPLNSTSAEVNGPSHEQGGVKLPNMDAELEGKETITGDYVFSERLGYAGLHRPIAKSIGKIEQKPISPERINSLKLLRHKEDQLKQSQEQTRQELGIN